MTRPVTALAAALAFAATHAPAARAQQQDGGFTVQTVIDRAEIEDLLQRYYANFGKAEGEAFSSFYADDAQFVLNGKAYRGKDEIAGVYKAIGSSGQSPAAGRFSFNVLMTNPVITVHGNAATAQMIFTEIVMDTATAPPRLLTQGREYDDLAKVDGHWRFARRQVMAGTKPPEGWVN
ncbi:MAG TPA: nuclear transport factor 2 family protein [Caulobacteraceae bacterium]